MDWSYGRQTVLSVLDSGLPVKKILLSDSAGLDSVRKITEIAQRRRIECVFVPKHVLDSLIKGNHQGVAAQIESVKTLDFKSFLAGLEAKKNLFVCLLDEIQDPGNLGAIARSAACFGCSGIIIPKWRSAGFTDTVLKSSSGAAAYIPMVEISNLSVAIERLKEKGFFVYGADASASVPLNSAEMVFPLAIVLGNEHRGIKPVLKKSCDKLISIPQNKAGADSLNVSAAAAVFFYEISGRMAKCS